jgi:hypothetical protein
MFFCIGCETAALGIAGVPVIGYLVTRFRAWRTRQDARTRPQRDPEDEAADMEHANG